MMLNSVARGGTAGGNSDLAIDRGEMGVDRARADDELRCHLLIRQSLGYQAQTSTSRVVGPAG